ncbi:MAG TPA: translation initiation factor IF-3 [Candidatus Bathyarchaeia archaeon]|nr:translation initiation factor IF-3 [Candidatus Bathyarchaeia archaeon]
MGKYHQKKFYRINQYIQASKLRVVDETGKQIGILSRDQALLESQKEGLDLVEIAPNAEPPVCKIIDFKKFRYLEAKKNTGKKGKKSNIKEVRLSPFIAENDLKNRIEKIRKFLKEKDQVKITIVFRGREIAKKEFGYRLAKTVIESLADNSQIGQEPKIVGRQLVFIIYPNEKDQQKKEIQN